eukprot:TRINITY_DN16883_c0_g1_i1.p1 TRINITY_DN16883_c0_g1~~TRINITY_DN16883_c0_g1_i1.p1  ORF type:complete len:1011 (+),score=110.15 TRINITY_DN16883_c0_g1_i1:53-3034(+)
MKSIAYIGPCHALCVYKENSVLVGRGRDVVVLAEDGTMHEEYPDALEEEVKEITYAGEGDSFAVRGEQQTRVLPRGTITRHPELIAGISCEGRTYPRNGTTCLAMTALLVDENRIFVGGMGGTIHSLPQGTRQAQHSHTGHIRCLAFDRKSNLLISGCDDRTVRIWNTEKLEMSQETCFTVHEARIWCVAIRYPIAASGGEDGVLAVYRLDGTKPTLLKKVKNCCQIHSVVITAACKTVLFGDRRGVLQETPADDSTETTSLNKTGVLGDKIRAVRPFRSGCHVASGTGTLIKTNGPSVATSFKAPICPTVMESSECGTYVILGAADGTVQLTDRALPQKLSSKVTAVYQDPERGFYSACDALGNVVTHSAEYTLCPEELKTAGIPTSIWNDGARCVVGFKNGFIRSFPDGYCEKVFTCRVSQITSMYGGGGNGGLCVVGETGGAVLLTGPSIADPTQSTTTFEELTKPGTPTCLWSNGQGCIVGYDNGNVCSFPDGAFQRAFDDRVVQIHYNGERFSAVREAGDAVLINPENPALRYGIATSKQASIDFETLKRHGAPTVICRTPSFYAIGFEKGFVQTFPGERCERILPDAVEEITAHNGKLCITGKPGRAVFFDPRNLSKHSTEEVLGVANTGAVLKFHSTSFLEATDLHGRHDPQYYSIDPKLSRRTAAFSANGSSVSYVSKGKHITVLSCPDRRVACFPDTFLTCDADFLTPLPSGEGFLSGGESGIPVLLSKTGLTVAKRYTPSHGSNVRCAAVADDGKHFYSAGGNEKIVKWSLEGACIATHAPKGTDDIPLQRILSISYTPTHIIACTTGGTLMFFTHDLIMTNTVKLKPNFGSILCAVYEAATDTVCAGGSFGYIVRLVKGEPHYIKAHQSGVNCVAVRGSHIATGGDDQSLTFLSPPSRSFTTGSIAFAGFRAVVFHKESEGCALLFALCADQSLFTIEANYTSSSFTILNRYTATVKRPTAMLLTNKDTLLAVGQGAEIIQI